MDGRLMTSQISRLSDDFDPDAAELNKYVAYKTCK